MQINSNSNISDLRTKKRQMPNDASPEARFATEIASTYIKSGAKHAKFTSDGAVMYWWNCIYWEVTSPEEGEKMAWDWLKKNCPKAANPRKAASCYAAALLECDKLPQPISNQVVIPARNSYLLINETNASVQVISPDPKFGLGYSISCDYDPCAKAPEFLSFLTEILPDLEVRNLVQEYIGYTLMSDTRFQKAQWWVGGGANGKGTLAQMVSALHRKTTALTLDNLDGFALSSLIGSSLIYVDETPQRINEQRIKTLLSGDLIQIDRKYRDPISFRPTAKWVVCANALPAITDHSMGFWRRWHVIPFVRHFAEHEQKPMLAQFVINNELPGILNWAIEGLLRLLARDKFPPLPKPVLDALAVGKRDTNSVQAWFDDNDIEPSKSNIKLTPKERIYRHYAEWCKSNGMAAVSSNKFWQRLKQSVPDIYESRETKGKRLRFVNLHIPGVESVEAKNVELPL